MSVLLGEVEAGKGLKHLEKEKDGVTTIVTVDNVPCRYMNREGREEGYMYFVIDPAFKQRDVKNVRLEVEYFDLGGEEQPAYFGIHYDASQTLTGSNPKYRAGSTVARLTNSGTWRMATFRIRSATFANAQNGGADFRIWARPPQLYVRRVTVTREGPVTPPAPVFSSAPRTNPPQQSVPPPR